MDSLVQLTLRFHIAAANDAKSGRPSIVSCEDDMAVETVGKPEKVPEVHKCHLQESNCFIRKRTRPFQVVVQHRTVQPSNSTTELLCSRHSPFSLRVLVHTKV